MGPPQRSSAGEPPATGRPDEASESPPGGSEPADGDGSGNAASRYLASLPTAQFPNLTALASHFGSVDPGERFELLLDIFVDGLAQHAAAG